MVEVAGKQIPKWAVMVVVFLVAGFAIGGISRCTETPVCRRAPRFVTVLGAV